MPEETAMTQELTTRDIFQQLDTRLTRVEDDLRTFRAEVITRFDQITARFDDRFDQINAQFNDRFDQINNRFDQAANQTNDRFDQMNARFDQTANQTNAQFNQSQWRMVSLIVITWITMIGSIWLKP